MHLLRDSSFYFLVLLCLCFPLIPGYSYYRTLDPYAGQPFFRNLPAWFVDVELSDYPNKISDEKPPEITAEAAFVIDVNSAVPIYKKNEHQRLSPASTTKIMTALVVLNEYDQKQVLEVPEATFTGSLMKLEAGDKVSVNNLLYGLLINSGNDAAEVLADYYSSGYQGFIERMNNYAVELGLKSSNFVNPSGLPAANHYMSAWDLGQLAAVAMKNDTFRKIVRIKELTVSSTDGKKYYLKSTNKLLGEIPGLDGVKTGYTEEAGEVLVSSVERGGNRIVVVVLKSNDRFGETKSLIDWVYKNHKWEKVNRPVI